MIMQYGMSGALGLRSYGEQSGNIFLGRTMTYDRDYSEEAARKIDDEIRVIVDRNYQRAHDILNQYRDKVVLLSEALIEHETIDRGHFETIMNEEPKVTSSEDSLMPAD
jgi:cell division protease FtsH